jgi:hypothetical protein
VFIFSQVGTLNQMLGIIDDAENSFQEGFQVAVSHGLSFAGAVFSSCLGWYYNTAPIDLGN